MVFFFNFLANVYFKQMADNTAVVEGEKLTIHCIAFGTDPEIYWVVGEFEILILLTLKKHWRILAKY